MDRLDRKTVQRRNDEFEELQHVALTGPDAIHHPSEEAELTPTPGPDPISETISLDDEVPPLEDPDSDDEDEAEDSYDERKTSRWQ